MFVDYAHTPDALATALKALRPHVMGRLIVVFGAGGDRDTAKRPLMGAAAAAHADVVIRHRRQPALRGPGRRSAPRSWRAAPRRPRSATGPRRSCAASMRCDPGDALLIAGKGHETGQIVGDDVFPFDDVEQASVAVAALDGRLA